MSIKLLCNARNQIYIVPRNIHFLEETSPFPKYLSDQIYAYNVIGNHHKQEVFAKMGKTWHIILDKVISSNEKFYGISNALDHKGGPLRHRDWQLPYPRSHHVPEWPVVRFLAVLCDNLYHLARISRWVW